MNDNTQLINSIGSIAVFLAVFPALWISGRIILRNLSPDNRFGQFFLWLALGGLILIPLTDFIRYLNAILNFLLPQTGPAPNMNVILGMGPYPIYAGLTLILGVAVYAMAIFYVRQMITQGKLSFIQEIQLRNWELGAVILGIVGLINHMIHGVVVGFVTLYLPNLTTQLDLVQLLKGFWISWLIAFLFLLVTLFVMNERLYKRENELIQ